MDEKRFAKSIKERATETLSDGLLRMLLELGADYVFLNSGTDYAPIIESLSDAANSEKSFPKPVVVPHEGPAVAMAMGYYLTSKRFPVVMVHTTPGTANSMANMLNAYSMNIPIMLMAGRTPVLEKDALGSKEITVHWNQELRDQAEMLRQFTKFDWEHRFGEQLEDEIVRAYEVSMNEPKGPVYMTWPRERLAEPLNKPLPGRKPQLVEPVIPDDEAMSRMAELLLESERPLVLTSFLGRNSNGVRELISLCEALALPVAQNFYYLNFPTTHPLYIGKLGGRLTDDYLSTSDAVFMIDVNVPWFPNTAEPPRDAKIIHLDFDPVKEKIPTWGFRADLRMRGDSEIALRLLREKMVPLVRARPDLIEKVSLRAERIRKLHESVIGRANDEAIEHRHDVPIDPRWLSHSIGTILTDNSIVFGETVHSPFVEYIPFSRPGCLFSLPPFGALGWSMGAALGAKLAKPDFDVFAVMGDGSYMYNVPVASHFVSRAMKLPIISIIYNNQEWLASKNAVRSMYPGGKAERAGSYPGTGLDPSPSFEKVAESSGARAVRISDPEEVVPSLRDALEYTKENKNQVLLNVVLKKP